MITVREKLYLLGIGGMGMAPLAIYLRQAGYDVAGHDDNLKPTVRRLLDNAGIELFSGKTPIPKGTDCVVISSAIAPDHQFYRAAQQRNIRILRRGEMLARLADGKKLIAVVGSHGKTTTSGMLIHALRQSGFDFGYVFGALFADDTYPACYSSDSEWLVAEVDESDGTIENFRPEISLVVNLDWDHPDQYKTEADLENTFRRLFERTSGLILYPYNAPLLQRLTANLSCKVRTFGCEGDYSARVEEFSAHGLKLVLGGLFPYMELSVAATGKFNARNAASALAILRELGIPLKADGLLNNFPGIRRRQTKLYDDGQLVIFEDYAHHPSEIGALLDLGKSCFADYKQVVVFQPHRYTRTKQYLGEFASVLSKADQLILLPVYAASEKPLDGGSTEDLHKLMVAEREVLYVDQYQRMEEALLAQRDVKALILFIGAGDIDAWAHQFVEKISQSIRFDDPAWWGVLAGELSSDAYCSREEPLAEKTTFRVGGPAQFYVEPANEKDLSLAVKSALAAGVPYFILGRGSNLIIPDEGYPGLVIRLNHDHWKRIIPSPGCVLEVGAGQMLKRICGEAAQRGMAGFEFLEGIPGTLGGALRMNAGAMGNWTFDVVAAVRIMTAGGEIKTLSRDEFHVGYRECRELKDAIALSAMLVPTGRETVAEIRARLQDYASQRKSSQPRLASAGCIFKNPEGGHAGKIIDELGLKGLGVGAAEVSEVHGNFIINTGGAKTAEVIELIKQIRKKVREERGIDLEPEVMLLGKDWKEVLA